MPFLPEGLLVMESWGYKYKASVVWEKVGRLGMGFWFRCQTEICLVGSKGKAKPFHCQSRNIIHAPSPGHSCKPDEFFKLVEPVTPEPRLEMFGRLRHPGWDIWGDQADGGSDVAIEVPFLAEK
jgi:N6-adenosine-specific RNA methylase IME4